MNEKVFHDDRVNGLIFDFFVAGAVSSSLESTALVRENQMDRKIFTVKIGMTKIFSSAKEFIAKLRCESNVGVIMCNSILLRRLFRQKCIVQSI